MDHLEQLRHAKESLRHYREIHSKASGEAARLEGWLSFHTTSVAALIKSAPDQELDLNADSRNALMQYWKAKYAEACSKRKVLASQLSQAQKHRDQTRQQMFHYVEIVFDLERQIEKEANKGKSHEAEFRGFSKARRDDKQDGSDQEDTSSRRGSTSSQSESEPSRKDRNQSKRRNDRKRQQQSDPQPESFQKDGDRSKTRDQWKRPRPSTPHPKPSQKARNAARFNWPSGTPTQIFFPSGLPKQTFFPDRVKEWYQQTTEIFPRYHELTAFPTPPVQGPCAKLSCRQNPSALAPACRCSIRAAFGLVPDLDLKKERTRWHPDKFSGCAEALREDFQQKAKEMFVVVEEMYDAAQKGRS